MKRRKLRLKNGGGVGGSFVIKRHTPGEIKWHRDEQGRVVVDQASLKAAMRAPLSTSAPVKNLVVSADGYGRNLLIRAMSNNTTYPIGITTGAIGTGTTAATDADTALETEVLDDIAAALFEISNDEVVVSFFIPDGDLADATYNEFAAYMGTQMFSRAIISGGYAKSGVDTTIEYTYTISPA